MNSETTAAALPLGDRSPLGPSWSTDPQTTARQQKLIIGFLVLGVLARCVRYFLNFPLWDDESFLCVNFIDRGFAELLTPLQFHQVAPPLFLWIELSIVRVFGYHELTLRLFPFVCSVASLFLFRRFARNLLHGPALVLAVAVFAVSYSGVRYAAEAKQYSSDLFVSLLLLTLAVEWWRAPGETRRLRQLTIVLPFALALSYTAVFIAGGISLFVGWVTWQRADRAWRSWVVFNAVLLGGFSAVYWLAARHQSGSELSYMQEYWQDAFPPLTKPLQALWWLVVTHASELVAFPVGGERGASILSAVCMVVGVAVLWKTRRVALGLLLLAPFAVHFVAAALQRYPYGGHVRFSQHLAPAVCILIGLGVATAADWFRQRGRNGQAFCQGALGVLALVALGCIGRDLAHPYKTESDMRARSFAQWFWFVNEHNCEILCLETDWPEGFSSADYNELSWCAMYLCNREIYSQRPTTSADRALRRVSSDHPLLCTVYHDPDRKQNRKALDDWLGGMQEEFQLVSVRSYPFPRYDKRETKLIKVDHLETYEFIPLGAEVVERRDERRPGMNKRQTELHSKVRITSSDARVYQ